MIARIRSISVLRMAVQFDESIKHRYSPGMLGRIFKNFCCLLVGISLLIGWQFQSEVQAAATLAHLAQVEAAQASQGHRHQHDHDESHLHDHGAQAASTRQDVNSTTHDSKPGAHRHRHGPDQPEHEHSLPLLSASVAADFLPRVALESVPLPLGVGGRIEPSRADLPRDPILSSALRPPIL